jgi:(1->4)-alpha-D-glucan 1-alpha-D-glucosylmutase
MRARDPTMMTMNWTATYRLQLHAGFPLTAAAAVVPYLAQLGISHVYLSPVLQSAPGSTHGYDVADPARINDALGGDEGWRVFQEAVRQHGLGVLLDIVPNHMTTHPANPWWRDVLTHGPYSVHAGFFDLDPCVGHEPWRIRLCTLGQRYGAALEAGELTITVDGEEPQLAYYENRWPLNPLSWLRLGSPDDPVVATLVERVSELRAQLSPDEPTRQQYAAAVGQVRDWYHDIRARPGGREDLEQRARALSAQPDELHVLLERQYYRLVWWKLEGELVNYRRFFNIGGLVGLRVEDLEVFQAAHARIQTMIAAGEIAGLRVDHPDGLRDPAGYLAELRRTLPEGKIYVEKILDAAEPLPGGWAVDGTVGYDFLAKVNRLWMAEQREDVLTGIYADFTGHPVNFLALVREKKLAILDAHFSADLDRLVGLAVELSRRDWRTRDFSRRQLRAALAALTAALPVYRTYRSGTRVADGDRDPVVLDEAFAQAQANATGVESDVFVFLRQLLGGSPTDEAAGDFMARWEQLAPAVMAKGAEDTTFYLYDRLVSCNEVGAQPWALGISAEHFHQFCHHLHTVWPDNLLATSTHDNKRSEDVRARISVLTELPAQWAEAVRAWSQVNQPAWRGRQPDRHAEYLLYQTLVGAWPISVERAREYMLKACREAKVNTSWHEPNADYENAVLGFTQRIIESREFVSLLEKFIAPLVGPGRINSLAQTLIKMTAPGVPDFYQGTELWDHSLVDPDNRRPVDFEQRQEQLERLADLAVDQVVDDWESGQPKLWMIRRTLRWRAEHPEQFGEAAAYEPLVARGARLGHLLAYRRGSDVLVVVPRFTLTLAGDWGDTVLTLPDGSWRNLFTEAEVTGEVTPPQLFGRFPVALLAREDLKGNTDAPST